MSCGRVTVAGKQLKLDERHLADCCDEEAAQVIAICLNEGRHLSRAFPVTPSSDRITRSVDDVLRGVGFVTGIWLAIEIMKWCGVF